MLQMGAIYDNIQAPLARGKAQPLSRANRILSDCTSMQETPAVSTAPTTAPWPPSSAPAPLGAVPFAATGASSSMPEAAGRAQQPGHERCSASLAAATARVGDADDTTEMGHMLYASSAHAGVAAAVAAAATNSEVLPGSPGTTTPTASAAGPAEGASGAAVPMSGILGPLFLERSCRDELTRISSRLQGGAVRSPWAGLLLHELCCRNVFLVAGGDVCGGNEDGAAYRDAVARRLMSRASLALEGPLWGPAAKGPGLEPGHEGSN